MKKCLKFILFFVLALPYPTLAQWPREIQTQGGAVISIYQPQPEQLSGDKIDGRAAFSVVEKPGDEMVFGVFWYTATMLTDRDERIVTLESIKITDVKIPGVEDTEKIEQFNQLLEKEIPEWELSCTIDEITANIETEQAYAADELKNAPPEIIYAEEYSVLVLIDGEPKLQEDKNIGMKRVINSAFFIVENPDDKKYYLNGGSFWYSSSTLKAGYAPVKKLPKSIAALDEQLKKQQTEKMVDSEKGPPAVVVSTVPAELIQSEGVAEYASLTGTNLLYVSNSENDIFKNVSDQLFYVLLSGRWYSAPVIEGPWQYIASDALPEDFAKIPEGSPKDNVLASVAGTEASIDAIHDAQVPQTAKVDRKTATCTVEYDGKPDFEKIEGTTLELAMNTSSTVIKSDKQYFCVENGVWFVADNAEGPWAVSDERPEDVDKIPPSSEAYNVKYVYIYDSTPDVVYVGYTPGYMGCYVHGPTVVYGTGYYYSPWYGPYYYPRPATFGFSMHYNPWTGWSMGFHYSTGFFNFSFYGGGGYWGPPVYRPPFYPPYRGGIYGPRGPVYVHNDIDINIDRSNNIYNKRNGVSTNDVRRGQSNRAQQPGVSTRDQNPGGARQPQASPQPSTSDRNTRDVYADRNGNVYQRNENGNWDQRQGNEWKQTERPSSVDRDYQNRQRSTQNYNNYQQMNRGGNLGGSYRSAGARPAGGMRRR